MTVETVKVSPSQITTFLTCQRKWAWTYIKGFRDPPKQASELGTHVHGILEAYAKDGTPPDPQETWQFEGGKTFYPGKIALNMITRVMPPPGVAVTEGGFEFQPGPSDPIFRGFVDLGYEGGAHSFPELDEAIQNCPGDNGVLVVVDHKTSSNPKQWGKTEESLRVDPQAIIYARAALFKWAQSHTGELPNVLCAWNYGATTGRASGGKIVFALFTPKEVFAGFKKLLPVAQLIKKYRNEEPEPNTLPFNSDACSMYGGCPNRDRCALTNTQKMESLLMGNSLLDQMLAKNQTPAATPAAVPNPPVAPADKVNPPEAAAAPAPVKPIPLPSKPTPPKAAPAPQESEPVDMQLLADMVADRIVARGLAHLAHTILGE